MKSRKRIVVSGMRPTGALHLGNYWGALKNWVGLQKDYKCYFFVADWHALTTDYGDTSRLRDNVRQAVLDWLTAGLDADKCVMFQQSRLPQHAELALLLSMITPLGWLERNPTYKDQLRELSEREIQTHGLLGYPVLQGADIFLYKGEYVPVGEDQLAHLELTREIARRFRFLYGRGVFPEPQPLLTPSPKVPGLDARKMSKSYGNAIGMAEPSGSLQKKIMSMYTDPVKIRVGDKGHPEGCIVFAMHRLYNPDFNACETECRGGRIGCVACKNHLFTIMDPSLEEFRSRRANLEGKKGFVEKILEEGSRRAAPVADDTLESVRRAMRLK